MTWSCQSGDFYTNLFWNTGVLQHRCQSSLSGTEYTEVDWLWLIDSFIHSFFLSKSNIYTKYIYVHGISESVVDALPREDPIMELESTT